MSVLIENVYTKLDDGSGSEWVLWDGESCQLGGLYAAGWIYVKARKRRGKWSLLYRMGITSDLDLPEIFDLCYDTDQQVVQAIHEFADWAFKNQFRLIEVHNRACE